MGTHYIHFCDVRISIGGRIFKWCQFSGHLITSKGHSKATRMYNIVSMIQYTLRIAKQYYIVGMQPTLTKDVTTVFEKF